ncbi:unnamed protein product [Symbiodinium sp. CCMP2592]|nr:unnamed protein product [Symbiodinium sp. CCMP2592]
MVLRWTKVHGPARVAMEAPESFVSPPLAAPSGPRSASRRSFRRAEGMPQTIKPVSHRQGRFQPSAKLAARGKGLQATEISGLLHGAPIAALVSTEDLMQKTIIYHSLRDICSLKASSRQLRDTCSVDAVWRSLYRLRWPREQAGDELPVASWRQKFVERLRRTREGFTSRGLPALMQKSRRRDGLPDLRKLHESLRVHYSLCIARKANTARFEFSDASVQAFDSAVCLRSSSTGREEILLAAAMDRVDDWGDGFVKEELRLVRSPCGRLLVAFWRSSSTLGRERADSFGSVAVSGSHSVIQTRDPANLPGAAQDAGRASLCADQRVRERKLHAQVCHFEVLAPHDSGLQPAFSCTRQPGIAFQTAAFRLFLADHVFVDATIFDDHGRVFWAVTCFCTMTSACSHESTMLEERKAQVDFDREGNGSGACQQVRWISLADRGAAHLVLQLEGAAQAREADEGGGVAQPLPRLNSITWHPELAFLDDWWGSCYAAMRSPDTG